jgi:hypothetical protein
MTSFDWSAINPTSTTVLWQGTSNDATNIMSGGKVANASYVVTEDAIKFASGVLTTSEEYLPLVFVRDADLEQSLTQKARGVGIYRKPPRPKLLANNVVIRSEIGY